MNKLEKIIHQLKWLRYNKIEYYCSQQKYDKKSMLKNFQLLSTKIPLNYKEPQSKSIQVNEIIGKTKEEAKTMATISKAEKLAQSAYNIKELKTIVENFDECELKSFSTNTVFSDGNPDARIVLIGEAPGANEDEQGIPFCGESGMLLDQALSAIGLDRKKNLYITNTVFWRPPANRKPSSEEIRICKPFLERHIGLLSPKLIILVGATASSTILDKKESISSLSKTEHLYTNKYITQPIFTVTLFHPAFLLRSPYKKKDVWFNLLKIRDYIYKKKLFKQE